MKDNDWQRQRQRQRACVETYPIPPRSPCTARVQFPMGAVGSGRTCGARVRTQLMSAGPHTLSSEDRSNQIATSRSSHMAAQDGYGAPMRLLVLAQPCGLGFVRAGERYARSAGQQVYILAFLDGGSDSRITLAKSPCFSGLHFLRRPRASTVFAASDAVRERPVNQICPRRQPDVNLL